MSTREIDPFIIYCDGACQGGNLSRVAGWGYLIIKDGNIIRQDSGRLENEENPTNQKAELQAAIEAIKGALEVSKNNAHPTFEVHSDSAYLINCIYDDWWKGWLAKGWRNSANKPVANQKYWEQLIPYFSLKTWSFYKVKGHSTDKYNAIADSLATKACKV